MTEAAPQVSSQELRALWLDVVRWPLRGGMLGGAILLTVLAFASARLEGGWAAWQREQNAYLQGVVFLAALLVLSRYAWRALVCTYPEERPAPWGRDEADETPFGASTGLFITVAFLAFVPMIAWITLRFAIGPARWVDWLVVFACAIYAGSTLPLGLAGAMVRGNALAALPGTVGRMRRAEPRAARIASATGVAFVGAFALSFLLASLLIRPAVHALPGDVPRAGDKESVGTVLLVSLFLLRAAGFHAALVSVRVAGLLVREVPEVREAAR